jgi:hypothetical protein
MAVDPNIASNLGRKRRVRRRGSGAAKPSAPRSAAAEKPSSGRPKPQRYSIPPGEKLRLFPTPPRYQPGPKTGPTAGPGVGRPIGSGGSLPPGLAKKAAGLRSARSFAPGQIKQGSSGAGPVNPRAGSGATAAAAGPFAPKGIRPPRRASAGPKRGFGR